MEVVKLRFEDKSEIFETHVLEKLEYQDSFANIKMSEICSKRHLQVSGRQFIACLKKMILWLKTQKNLNREMN